VTWKVVRTYFPNVLDVLPTASHDRMSRRPFPADMTFSLSSIWWQFSFLRMTRSEIQFDKQQPLSLDVVKSKRPRFRCDTQPRKGHQHPPDFVASEKLLCCWNTDHFWSRQYVCFWNTYHFWSRQYMCCWNTEHFWSRQYMCCWNTEHFWSRQYVCCWNTEHFWSRQYVCCKQSRFLKVVSLWSQLTP